MLPRARTCASRQLRHSITPVTQSSRPKEPLLFLYPRWFRTDLPFLQCAGKDTAHSESEAARSAAHVRTPTSKVRKRASQNAPSSEERNALPPCHNASRETALGLPKSVEVGTKRQLTERTTQGALGERVQDECSETKSSEPHTTTRHHDAVMLDGLMLARKLAGISNPTLRPPKERIKVSTDFLNWFAGTATQNMWLLEAIPACKFVVLAPDDSNQDYREVVLDGSKTSQEKAGTYLARQIEDFRLRPQIPSISRPLELASSDPLTSTFEQDIPGYRHVDAIPVPQFWNVQTFYNYVKTIVEAKVPKAVERAIYASSKGFDQAATRALLKAFSAPELRFCQSVAALRLVMESFRQRTHLATNIGQIWNVAVENGLVPDTTSFNIELQRCLAVKNNERISYLVRTMQIAQVSPDASTWALLLKMLNTTSQRRKIVKALVKSKQFATPRDQEILVRGLIQVEFQGIVIQEDGIPRFADWLRRTFGEAWLSPGAVSDMVSLCIRSKVSWKVHEVLDIARYFGINLDEVDSVALLDVIRRTRHFGDTMSFFSAILRRDHSATAQSQLELLFKTAWSQKLFNTCRLIWRFCASHGMINYAMRILIGTNLAMNHGVKTDQGHLKRDSLSWLAAVTVGTDTEIHNFEQKFPLLSGHHGSNQPATLLCQWMPNNGQRHEQLQLAHLLLERDLTASSAFMPMRHESFLNGLSAAYSLDRQWQRTGLAERHTVSELSDMAMKVGLHRKSHTQTMLAAAPEPTNTSPTDETIASPKEHSQPEQVDSNPQGIGEDLRLPADTREVPHTRTLQVHSSSIPSTVVDRCALAPTIILTSSSLLDVLFQHLQGAIGAD